MGSKMMKFIIPAILAGSAAAFSPVQTQSSSLTALSAFEDELGAQPPLGFFDPLGLVADGDQEKFDRLRYTEIKHGRISMLAFLGQITTRYGIHLGGSIDNNGDAFDSFPSGIAAIQGDNAIPGVGLAQIVAFIGVLELFVMKDIEGTGNEFAGDLRNGSLDFGWDTFDEEAKITKRAVELNNGRAAMLGILGLMVHEELGGVLPIVGQM